MREIKFRAWAEKTVNNVWEYVYPLAKAEAKESLGELDESELRYKYSKQWQERNPGAEEYTKTKEMITDITVNGERVIRPYGYEVIDVMQYTGLRDKNGKEIYEGDVVQIRTTADGYKEKWDTEHSYTVIYDEERAKFRLKEQSDVWGMIWKMEIIGNIYENPELLTNPN